MLRFFLLLMVLTLAGCSSCGEDTGSANNGTTNNDIVVRPEQDAGSGPCQGCFDDDDVCQSGDSDEQCGGGGTQCSACDDGTTCNDDGECVVPPNCTPETCDGCCDENDACQAGDQTDACGTGGNRCGTCPEGGSCNEGQCAFGCGPDNCNGCCDADGTCQTGMVDAACGLAGGTCADCTATDAVCNGGSCVATGCAQTCAGCCDGDQCVDPVDTSACGSAGGACVECAAGDACNGGMCVPPTMSGGGYDVTLISADLPSTKLSGFGWDTFGGLPDVFAYVYSDEPGNGDSWFEQSSVKVDTLTPDWNEVVLTNVSLAALGEGLWFELWDEDDTFDDRICIMGFAVTDIAMAQGQVIESICDEDPEVVWRWRVDPTP